ncbi:serine/threonine-protein kinase [Nocardia sp. NPDC088792]|uniref:serine/threonine-protein kinase n=1 Tax=Nocardia sp. NPDC088792 TaxID=3364332 RepID=UPI00382C4A83
MRSGEVFAGYRIERELGTGGAGTVYLARHARLRRRDALKVPSTVSSRRDFPEHFLREAEFAARLHHPNVVAIHGSGIHEGCPWIAMQYVSGCDAEQLARAAAPLPARRAVHIITEAARGLDAAHAAGLLHRDVKPANLLIAPTAAGPDRVLVTDFGIARATDPSGSPATDCELTATPAYAAPEQISGIPVDRRADVYALGGTLFRLLTGALPFARRTPEAMLTAHLYAPPPQPSAVNPAVPPEFDAVIARAMAKRPADRYPGCGALAAAARIALYGATHREPVLVFA